MSRSFRVPLLLPADPTNALEATTKQYVDNKISLPVGVVLDWDTDDAIPGGWIEANGAAFSAGTYPDLAAVYETNTTPYRSDVPVYASVAERDSLTASAPNGAVCITVDTGILWQRIAGTWQDPRPRGLVAWRQGYRTNYPVTATPLEIYKVTTTLTANRAYRWSFQVRAIGVTANGHVRFQASSSPALAGSVIDDYVAMSTANGLQSYVHVGRLMPGVTQAYAITVNASMGAGTASIYTDGEGCVMMIEDIGLNMTDVSG